MFTEKRHSLRTGFVLVLQIPLLSKNIQMLKGLHIW